jgi:hypothetical protein
MTPDGERTIPAKTKQGGEEDGGALRSSLAVYSIPLYAAPPQERVSEAMVELVRKAAQEHEPRLHEVADALALSVALITDEMVEAGEQALTAALPALKQDEPHPKVAHLDLCHRDDVLNRITETTDE